MFRNYFRCLAVAAICAVSGFGGYALLHPHAAYAGCGAGNCMAAPGCGSSGCMTQSCGGGNCVAPCPSQPCVVDLVTDAEAGLPNAAQKVQLLGEGIIPPPTITQVSPAPGAVAVHSPFALKIDFTAQPNEPIDVSSVKVVYEKNPEIDLTPRLRPYISAEGISVPASALPPGSQTILVHVADKDFHGKTVTITIAVQPH